MLKVLFLTVLFSIPMSASKSKEPHVFEGKWKINAELLPGSQTEFVSLEIVRETETTFSGRLNEVPFKDGRIEITFGDLYFAFTSIDRGMVYYHSGQFKNNRLEGVSHVPSTNLRAQWVGIRESTEK